MSVTSYCEYSWVKSSNQFAGRVSPLDTDDVVVVVFRSNNEGNGPAPWKSSADLMLVDDNGRRFEADSSIDIDFAMWRDEVFGKGHMVYYGIVEQDINPGVQKDIIMNYIIPSNAKISHIEYAGCKFHLSEDSCKGPHYD